MKTTLYLLVALLTSGETIVLDQNLSFEACTRAADAGLVFTGPALRKLQGAELTCQAEEK